MKILFITTDVFFKGGIQRYSRYQYQALQELYGSENVFLASLLGDREFCFEEEINVEYIQGGLSILDKLRFVKACLKLIKKHGIDQIVINHRQLSPIGFLAKKLFGVSYFTNVYGLEIWSGMGKIETYSLLHSDKLIGDCNFIIEYIDEHYTFPRDKMELLYDPVDLDVFSSHPKNETVFNKYNIPKDKFILSTIGRLARNKGHETVIKALKQLDDNIIYVIVGGGKYDKQLKELVIKEAVADRVYFVGRVPENELIDFYNLADVVILLSTFGEGEGEGLPLGLIEASACKRPIIAGNEDGSIDAISKIYPNGFMIDSQNSAQLQEKINLYVKDRELLQLHGINGRKFVEENFDYLIFKKTLNKITLDRTQGL